MNPSDRGPLIIAGGIVLAGLFIAVALYLSRGGTSEAAPTPIPSSATGTSAPPSPASIDPTEADKSAKDNLERTLAAAEEIRATDGDLSRANGFELAQTLPRFTFQPSVRESTGPADVSVSATPVEFSASAQSDSGTCFWIMETVTGTDPPVVSYGAGTPCTGRAAASSTAGSWPA